MRIAREFSILLGHDIVFDELVEEEKLEQKVLLLKSSVASRGVDGVLLPQLSSSAGDKSTSGGPRGGLISSVGNDNDYSTDSNSDSNSDSDSEIEGYDCSDEKTESTIPLTNYLRICLELILAPDTDKDAHDKQLSALKSIPRIVENNPVDAGDVCGPLLRELLRLNNNFNTDNFDELKLTAVQSLLVRYPNLSVPVLCWALEEEAFSISVRIFAISCLARGAFILSGLIKPISTIPLSIDNENEKTNREKKKDINKNEINHEMNQRNQNDLTIKSKTTIKRPLKLAATTKKKIIISNNFGPLGPIFFYPILRLLAIIISNNTSNQIKKEKSKVVHNGNFIHAISVDDSESDNENIHFYDKLSMNNSPNRKKERGKKREECISSVNDFEEGDGLHSMLPVEALLALAAFVKCSLNSVYQRYVIIFY